MKRLLLLLPLLISIQVFGQYYSTEEINRESLDSWNEQMIDSYAGTYHFGVSEGESQLMILVEEDMVVAQMSRYIHDDRTGGFVKDFETFTNVEIKGNKFYSDQTNGEFVILNTTMDHAAGLWVEHPWTYEISAGGEFGPVSSRRAELDGNYPFASMRILSEQELKRYNAGELKLMRNEIFARYGMIFQEGREMDRYFSEQEWYRKKHEHVAHWFTEIELHNLASIKKMEYRAVNMLSGLPTPLMKSELFKGTVLLDTYELDDRFDPWSLEADFNGDGNLDIALLIREMETGMRGFAIIHGGDNLEGFILGAGVLIKNGLSEDMSYIDDWSINYEEVNEPGLDEHTGNGENGALILKNPSLQIEKSEVGGGQIYWDKECHCYAYFHQTC